MDVAVHETIEGNMEICMESEPLKTQRRQIVLKESPGLARLARKRKQSIEDDEGKRPRMDVSMDPLIWLKEDELYEVMKYLSGKELLKLTEVSKSWKGFIESRNLLMNRAMKEVLVKPKNLFLSAPNHATNFRPYKHMESPFIVTFNEYINVLPIHCHASSLETLQISDFESKKGVPGCNFPRLWMLKYYGFTFDFLKDFSFPNVTHLKLSDGSHILTFDGFKESLYKFPKLKCLNINYWGMCEKNYENRIIQKYQRNPEKFNAFDEKLPKIEEIYSPDYHGVFMKSQQNSLQILELHLIDLRKLFWVVRDLKVLKSLTIIALVDSSTDDTFQENSSIEVLKISHCHIQKSVRRSQVYENLLSALPSLKELLVPAVNVSMIEFIACNMLNLKTLSYRKRTSEAVIEAYGKVKAKPRRYLNSNFEMWLDPDHEFEYIRKKFY